VLAPWPAPGGASLLTPSSETSALPWPGGDGGDPLVAVARLRAPSVRAALTLTVRERG